MSNKLNGAVVAITGAGSGIGRALALACAELGASVAISDINDTHLIETQDLISKQSPNCNVHVTVIDVAKKEQVFDWAEHVANHFGQVNVVINNAGVALAASFEGTDYENFEWLMNINFWGVVHGCKAFMPHLQKAQWGHIVNVSSLFGLISVPNNSAYNAAKFAVRGFTESLRTEMLVEQKHIEISCVHPGGIKTNIVNDARFCQQVGEEKPIDERKSAFNEVLARTTPEQAAQEIIKGVLKNKPRILIGRDAKAIDLLQRFLPAGYQKLASKLLS